MEISRKNISTADIISKEKEILERIQAVKEKYDPVFDELGYELCAEYLCRGEFDDEFYEINYKEENYVDGYVSRANFTVKRKFKDGEPEITVDDDYETEEEREIAVGALRAQAEREREIAYTEIMMVRIYKTFWIERVSFGGDVETLEADLEEFAAKLREMGQEET